jgi:hypothetical protein
MTRLFAIFVLLLAVAGASFGFGTHAGPKSPIGTWIGKLSMKLKPEVEAKLTPQQRTQQATMLASLKFTLKIQKGGTYSIAVSGAGNQPPSSGKWTQSGTKITLTSDKATAGNKSQVATLAAGGKKLTIQLPPNPNATGMIVFTR